MFNQAAQELITVRDLPCFAVSRFNDAGLFFGHGNDDAHDKAAYLILHTLNLPLDTLESCLDAKLLQSEREGILSVLERRVVGHIPVVYLTHQAWQGEFDFYVDERVIIPRSSIYELLNDSICPWTEHDKLAHRASDLCTGSGCLVIQMAHHYLDIQIDAVNLSSDAPEVATASIEGYGLEDRISLMYIDLFEGLDGAYDLIVSNPPYVDVELVEALPDEYLHEPELVLGNREDGLDVTRQIILQVAEYLNPRGVLLTEIDRNREVLEVAYPELLFTRLKTSGDDGFVSLLTCERLLGEEQFIMM